MCGREGKTLNVVTSDHSVIFSSRVDVRRQSIIQRILEGMLLERFTRNIDKS